MPMSQDPSKRTKLRSINAGDKEDVVKKRLTEFYCHEIATEPLLKHLFNHEGFSFLNAGAFGHVFQVNARKDITFGELDALTDALTINEKHEYLNRINVRILQNPSDIAIRRGSSMALKCETAFNFKLEHFPVNQRLLPDADTQRFSLYKEFNTLCSIYNRFGYKETRGFTKPYAFGRLGNYTFVQFEGIIKVVQYGFHFMLLELCGPDMEDMMEICCHNCKQNDQRLATRTVFLVGDQFLSRLQCIQETEIGLSHNDLKCDQLMTGRWENTNVIYLIDYGLVSKYRDSWNSSSLIPVGNRRWAPRSNHQMGPRTPLCEIESACYVLLRLLKNHFPWDGMYDRQIAKLKELKDCGEDDMTVKSGDTVLYEEKQYLWLYLKRESGRKSTRVIEGVEQEIEKYKDFFEDRNDKWGDGGSQMQELMIDLVKMTDPLYLSFTEKKIDYADINYTSIRKHLLSIFDLSMYASGVQTATMPGPQRLQTEAFFRENRERKVQRTECGRPVYYYFPEGEQHVYWEWYCKCKDIWENKPEYWHKVLANREELADQLRLRLDNGRNQQTMCSRPTKLVQESGVSMAPADFEIV